MTKHISKDRQVINIIGIEIGSNKLPAHYEHYIDSAEILVGGGKIIDLFSNFKGERIFITAQFQDSLDAINLKYEKGKSILILATGDPLFFGIASTLSKKFGQNALKIMPSPSSLQHACARIALPWHDMYCISLHGRNNYTYLNTAILSGQNICILTDKNNTPPKIISYLLNRGVDWFQAHIFENMNVYNEKYHCLDFIDVLNKKFSHCSVIILKAIHKPSRTFLGIAQDDLQTQGNLITKKPIRACIFSLLNIKAQDIVWDIGAGSGAVSLEATSLAHQGSVFAVEQNANRITDITENRKKFAAVNLEIIKGQAPKALKNMPSPNCIFVGGGLSNNSHKPLLKTLTEQLLPNGRLVVSCVILKNLQNTINYIKSLNWPIEVSCIQASATKKILIDDLYLQAMNPIFLIATTKPE